MKFHKSTILSVHINISYQATIKKRINIQPLKLFLHMHGPLGKGLPKALGNCKAFALANVK